MTGIINKLQGYQQNPWEDSEDMLYKMETHLFPQMNLISIVCLNMIKEKYFICYFSKLTDSWRKRENTFMKRKSHKKKQATATL